MTNEGIRFSVVAAPLLLILAACGSSGSKGESTSGGTGGGAGTNASSGGTLGSSGGAGGVMSSSAGGTVNASNGGSSVSSGGSAVTSGGSTVTSGGSSASSGGKGNANGGKGPTGGGTSAGGTVASSTGGSANGGGAGKQSGTVALTISPKTATASFSGSVRFTANVTGVTDTSVTWSVTEGAPGGSVSATGVYTAPAQTGTFHVVATSNADSSKSDSATVSVTAPVGTPPTLTVGTWVNLTPPGVNLVDHYGILWVEIDPSDPRTLYICTDTMGLWKTTDGGSNWKVLGDPAKSSPDKTSGYLDGPIEVRVDPGDPKHLYATQGVRGETLGFWVSTDGGSNWTQPDAFSKLAMTTTRDVTSMDVDPTDFKHVIVGSHSPWGSDPPGIMETKDGGQTWIAHKADPSWNVASMGVHFLFNPDLGLGNSQTWLICDQSAGFFRTENSGTTWTKVFDSEITHHGNNLYYTKTGMLYAGAAHYPARSMDNGKTWTALKGLPDWYYYTVYGDGTTLYTQVAFTGDNGGQGLRPYMVSPETDGTTWTQFQGGKQTFSDGPFVMRYDDVNHIMYSANWNAGFWALKTQ